MSQIRIAARNVRQRALTNFDPETLVSRHSDTQNRTADSESTYGARSEKRLFVMRSSSLAATTELIRRRRRWWRRSGVGMGNACAAEPMFSSFE
jgi:hypothetical protein